MSWKPFSNGKLESQASETVTASRSTNAASVWGFSAFAIIVSIAMSLLLGKDMHWDLYNYHLYSPHAALHFDLAQDFMGAGWLRYINPYAAVPFYLMVMADWPAVLISATLSTLHALNIILIWWIGREYLFKGANARDLVAIATLLGVSTTVFIGLVGSSFTDPLTSSLLISALALLMHSVRSPRRLRCLVLAGLVAGIATGLKLTNGIFAVALCVAALSCGNSLKQRVTSSFLLGLCVTLGVLVSAGWWASQLAIEFGNPLFPLQNALFKSPDFPLVSLHNERFVGSAMEQLTLPLRMVQHKSWLYYEVAAPDLRFAAIIGFFAVGAVLQLARYLKGPASASGHELDSAEQSFWIFFVVGFALWVVSSSNARYGLVIMLLAGPALVHIASRTVSSVKLLKGLILALSSAQIIMLLHVGNPRWADTDWTSRWFEYSIPPQLQAESSGYLSLGTNSLSSLIPFLHPDSRMISITGLYAIDPQGPGNSRVHAFIARHRDRLRVLAPLHRTDTVGRFKPSAFLLNRYNQQLAPWNLSIAQETCLSVREERSSIDIFAGATGGLLTCALNSGSSLHEAVENERKRYDPIFDRLEKVCPKLFRPKGVYSVPQGTMWTRRYFDTDTMLFARAGRIRYSRYEFGPFDVDLGSVESLSGDRVPQVCQ